MRFPFMTRANAYVNQAKRGLWNQETTDDRERTIRRMDRILKDLYKHGRISTVDPRYMTEDDIQTYWESQLDDRMRSKEMVHRETRLLLAICDDCRNPDAEYLMRKYHRFFHRDNQLVPLACIDRSEIQAIIDGAMRQDNFVRMRAYTGCLLAYGIGARTKEVQYCKAALVDLNNGLVALDVVKGLGKYGRPRVVPIRPEVIPVLRRYMDQREKFLNMKGMASPYLFFNISNGNHLGTNMSQKMREIVMDDLGISFDFRACRRTFFSTCRDDGAGIDDLVAPAGHRDDRQLRTYYINYESLDDALKLKSKLTEAQRRNLRNQNQC